MEFIWAFLVGGALCTLAQLLIDKTKLTPARILVLYVVAGTFLTFFGLYEPLINFASAGASVPLAGFGYVLAKGAEKAVMEQGALGILTGGLTGSAAGITAAILFGYLVALIFRPKAK